MNQFQLALCDDEAIHIENICRYLSAYESESGNVLVVEYYESAQILLDELKNEKKTFDIIFLDVDMPNLSGMDAAMAIRKFNIDIVICFITSYENYAYQAFLADAAGYLMKPVTYNDFKRMINKCIAQIQYTRDCETAEDKFFDVKTERSHTVVPMRSIVYIEKRRNKCVIHLNDKEVTSYDTLVHVYEHLNQKQFYYVHQGYIVNFDYIKEVLPDRILLAINLEIPLSRKYYKTMYELHMNKLKRLQSERRRDLR